MQGPEPARSCAGNSRGGRNPVFEGQRVSPVSTNKLSASCAAGSSRCARGTLRNAQMDDLNAELAMAELERTWAARRSELSQRLDTAVQGAIAGVLEAAGQLRQAMELDAATTLDRVRGERIAIAQEVAQLRAEQAGLAAEIASARQRAEQES